MFRGERGSDKNSQSFIHSAHRCVIDCFVREVRTSSSARSNKIEACMSLCFCYLTIEFELASMF